MRGTVTTYIIAVHDIYDLEWNYKAGMLFLNY